MNFHDFLRGVFGLHHGQYPRQPEGPANNFSNPFWDDQEGDADNDLEDNSPHGFGFNIFSGDMMDVHKYFEQQMQDMLRSFSSMGAFDFGSDFFNAPQEGRSIQLPNTREQDEMDIRDRYLKPHSQKPLPLTENADTDIDERVQNGGLDSLLKSNDVEVAPRRSTFGRSQITKVIIGPNGHYEETKSQTKSDGEQEVIVTRKIGDQVHKVVTKTNKTGTTEKLEEFINMDEDELQNFNRKWTSPRTNGANPVDITPSSDSDFNSFFNLPVFRFFR